MNACENITGKLRNTLVSINNTAPFVEAKWELYDDKVINSTVEYSKKEKKIIKCAIACDNNGAGDIKQVRAVVYYPDGSVKDSEFLTLAKKNSICWDTVPGYDKKEFEYKFNADLCNIYTGDFKMQPKDSEGSYTVIVNVTDAGNAGCSMNNSFYYNYTGDNKKDKNNDKNKGDGEDTLSKISKTLSNLLDSFVSLFK